jgi:hypothetical protein
MNALKCKLLAGIFLALVLAPIQTALACSCLGPSFTIESSLSNSETAVNATIQEVLVHPSTGQSGVQYYRAYANRVVKGCGLHPSTEFYIKTVADSALCGVDSLQASARYVLFGSVTNEAMSGFLRANQTVLTIDLCQAHLSLDNVDQATMLELQNRPVPICGGVGASRSLGLPPSVAPVKPLNICQLCPAGYFDGCNNCNCVNGAPSCEKKNCARQTSQYCFVKVGPTPVTINLCGTCPKGFSDGCNECDCYYGRVGLCTKKYCTTKTTPKCVKFDICRVCPNGFTDQCNTCHCEAGSVICTKKFCGAIRGQTYPPPKCVK